MKISMKVVICAIVVATAGLAYAEFSKPEDAISYRKAVMTIIGHHFGDLAAVVQGKVPYDKKRVLHDATVIQAMAELPWDAVLYPGSDKGDTTLKSSALQEKDKLMSVAHQLESSTQKLAEIAKNGDMAALKAQFGTVAGDCKTCHSTFRHR